MKKIFKKFYINKIIKAIIALFFSCVIAIFFSPYVNYFIECEMNSKLIISENMFFVCMIIAFLAINVALWYIILNIENAIKTFKKKNSPMDYLFGIVLAATVAIMYNPLSMGIKMTSFDRQIGHGVIRNHNVEKLVSNFYIWFFLIIAIAFFFALIINSLRDKFTSCNSKTAFEFLDKITIIAASNLVFRYITIFQENSLSGFTFYYTFALINLLIIAVISYIVFIEKKTDFETFFSLLIMVISISLPLTALIKVSSNNGKFAFVIQGLLTLILIVILSVFKVSESLKKVIPWVTLFAASTPLTLSIFIEGINILHSHSIFLVSLRRWFLLVMFIIFTIIAILFFVFKKSNKANIICKSITLPLLLVGFTALSVQIPLSSVYNADIFETANSSILITDFLNFGKIPIVEHYGGHMMQNVWEGIIYGLLNSDSYGAAFSPYAGYVYILYAIGLYYLMKLILDEKTAFFSILFLPLMDFTAYWCMGCYVIIAVAAYIRKNTYLRAMLVWFSCVWCVLHRLDLGASFAIAGVIVLLIYIIENKKLSALKQLGLTLAGYIVFFGGLWFSLCLVKDINPVSRLVEFIKISASNLNWARNTIGDNANLLYSICYFFIPILILGMLVYSIFSKNFHKKAGIIRWVLYFLGIAYYTNFQRALVRHSLEEGRIRFIWTGFLFIALFICCFAGRKLFIPVTTASILINSLLITDENYKSPLVLDSALRRLSVVDTWKRDSSDIPTQWEMYMENGEPIQRVLPHAEIEEYIIPIESVVELLLEDNETFLDFSNRTFIYSALGKECPVYVSQSPLQLSGEYCQEEFITSIESISDRIPIAIMPINDKRCSIALDGILNSYRYYKVSEYIYQNYTPLCLAGDNAIWCDVDKYDYYAGILNNTRRITDIFDDGTPKFTAKGMEIKCQDGKLILSANGKDPRWIDFSDNLDMTQIDEEYSTLNISCFSKLPGHIKIYYTTEEREKFSEKKTIKYELVEGVNDVCINLPSTDILTMRLDLEGLDYLEISNIELLKNNSNVIIESADYMPEKLHSYFLFYLPYIWAELGDSAVENKIVSSVEEKDGYYKITNADKIEKSKGNYILVTATINNDAIEFADSSIKLGNNQGNNFIPECSFKFNALSGTHDYIFRVSSDYSWYENNLEFIQLECEVPLTDVSIAVLEGD